MTSSHEQKLRKLLNLRPDDKPADLAKDKQWPPPLPAELVSMVDDHERMTRNHRGGRDGVSVEIQWSELIVLAVCWRAMQRTGAAGVTKPPAQDSVTAPDSLAALRKRVQEKTGKSWDELMQANRSKLEAMLNG
jgi:hypothetical protein